MELLAEFYILILAAPAVRGRNGLPPREWAAETLANERAELSIEPVSLLNRISRLRYHVDMRRFWEFVIEEYGEPLAWELLAVIKPNGNAFRKKIAAMSKRSDDAWLIVNNHHRSLQ